MSGPFAAAMATIYASQLAEDAVYVPRSGPRVACRVVRSQEDVIEGLGGAGSRVPRTVIGVPAAVANRVRKGDGFEIGRDWFEVLDAPTQPDSRRQHWRCPVIERPKPELSE